MLRKVVQNETCLQNYVQMNTKTTHKTIQEGENKYDYNLYPIHPMPPPHAMKKVTSSGCLLRKLFF